MATIRTIIEQYREKYKDTHSRRQIIDLICKEHKGINKNSVRRTYYRIENELPRVLVETLKETPKYSVVKDDYLIYSQKGNFYIPIELADKMFYDFSVHGLNLSSTQMINKYGLEVWKWHSIKNALRLYKQSNIFSPHSLLTLSKEEQESVIADKIAQALQDKLNVENVYNKTVIKEYKKRILEDNKKSLYEQAMLSGLFEELPKIKVEKYIRYSANHKDSEHPEINVFISDLHNGSKIENLHLTENYSPEILREKLLFAAEQINKLKAPKVTLSFLGDLIESFTGLNHPTTWKEMEYGMYGAKLVKNTVELLLEFISKIANVKQIIAVAGNHDRGDSSNKVDYKGEIAGIIFYWLQNVLDIPVKFDFECVSENIDGIQYVVMHGHHKETTESSEKIILNYGKQGCYNLIVTGHLHTLKIKSDAHNFRHVVCPSVFTGNTYSERSGWTSTSGIMIAYNNGTNKASLNIISI